MPSTRSSRWAGSAVTSQTIGQHTQGVVGANRRDALRREREYPRQLRVGGELPARAPCRGAPGARERTRPSTAGSRPRHPRHARRVPSRHPIVPRSAPMARAEARSPGTVERAPTCPPSRASREPANGVRRRIPAPGTIRYIRPSCGCYLAFVPDEQPQQLRFAQSVGHVQRPERPQLARHVGIPRAACA